MRRALVSETLMASSFGNDNGHPAMNGGRSPIRQLDLAPTLRPGLAPAQAAVEASRCLYCADAPCMAACPTRIDVAQFIRKIATGNPAGAARTILAANVLGASCARACPVEVLCEGACVLNHLGQPPVAIGRLQGFATDTLVHLSSTQSSHQSSAPHPFEAGPDTGRAVAVVGGGPAGLAAAHALRRLGHRVVLFERDGALGGLDRTGVAPWKLLPEQAEREADWLLGIGGIDLRLGVELGVHVSAADLERDFDAVFLATGLGGDAPLGVPGEHLSGVHGAVSWIAGQKLHPQRPLEGVRRCVVVGAGNTALDAARAARAAGIGDVTLAYRGAEGAMSGYAHEWHAAKSEGVRAVWHAQVAGFESAPEAPGRLAAVQLAPTGQDKRPVAGAATHLVPADLALVATGRTGLAPILARLEGLRFDAGRLAVDASGATGRPGWFAGGDLANGGLEVVHAVADATRVARAIDASLARSAPRPRPPAPGASRG